MDEHVPMLRLLEVAADDTQIFTWEEFNHLKQCAACFAEWADFVRCRQNPEWQAILHVIRPE
jgi:hypothetical protein